MIKDFNKVCATMSYAKTMNDDAEKVLNFLTNNEGRFKAQEIATGCGWGYSCGGANHQRASSSLKFLVELGLVRKVIEETPIEIEVEKWIYVDENNKPYEIWIDGVRYERQVDWRKAHNVKTLVKKTVINKTSYFALAE